MVENEKLFELFLAEADPPFSGWDFSFITGTRRMVEAPLSWSYTSKIVPKLLHANSLLDMGTGGGEFLSRLRPLPSHTFATEGYPPNIPIARSRLEPLGIQVLEVTDDESLPFADNSFDLIINRHESYSAAEVHRILKPGGLFLTQQVGGRNDHMLSVLLQAESNARWADWHLETAVEALRQKDFDILEQKEEFPITRYYDVGAILYYLKAVPWQIQDFSVEKYREQLFNIHHRIQRDGFLDVPAHRFFLAARVNK
jgi:SAM-dependent methyltransferase